MPAPGVAAAVLESLADGLYVVDREGRLVLLNGAAEALLGFEQAELLGRDMHDAIHFQDARGRPLPQEACALLGVLRSGMAVRVAEDAFTRKDGRIIEVTYTSSAILEDGEITGAVVVFRDVTEVRSVERRADRLSAEREEAGAELQRNLLPGLAEVPGLDVDVAFRPVGASALVGGDFYDVVPSGDGHLVVVGDVCGKGPAAAALAAVVRSMLRGGAWASGDPPRLLRRLNAELLVHPAQRFCTLALAHVVRRDDGTVEVAASSAGHPRPVVLRADGTTEEVGAAGPIAGVVEDPEFGAGRTVLAPGDALVLYTDGLTDVGRLEGRPPVDVPAVLAGATGSAAEIVSHLERAAGVPDIEDRPDDVAVLVARLEPRREEAAVPPPVPAGGAPADPAEVGRVEAGFREENERLAEGRPADAATVAVTCECGHPGCEALVEVPHAAYDRVRADGRSFVVVPGHEIPRAEAVVERHPTWVVVRKHGRAGEVAEAEAP